MAIPYCSIGSAALRVSRLAFGGAAIGGHDYGSVDDSVSIRAIHAAVDAGINFFDVADVYGLGHAEDVLGRALSELPSSARDGIVIATKVGVRWDESGRTTRDLSPQWIREAVRGSLERLRVSQIALYQIHWPDRSTSIESTMEALGECVGSGLVATLGCCNFTAAEVTEAQRYGRLDTLQLPYNAAERATEVAFRDCRERHGMITMAYNALAQGLFTGKYGRQSVFSGTDLRQRSALFAGDALEGNLLVLERLRSVASRHGLTPAQVAIRWTLDQPAVDVVLAGIKTSEQVKENVAAVDWDPAAGDLAEIIGNGAHVA